MAVVQGLVGKAQFQLGQKLLMTQFAQLSGAAVACFDRVVPERCQVTEKTLTYGGRFRFTRQFGLALLKGDDLLIERFEALQRCHGKAPGKMAANHVAAEEGACITRLLP